MDRTIVADKLVKTYEKTFRAVDEVSFEVKSGEVFGFLGPNGAGKSTVVSMLTTLALPTAGQGQVGGYDIIRQADHVRRIAGVALQEIGIDPVMKSMELLQIQGQLFGLDARRARRRAEALLQIVKLEEFVDRPVGKYSGGMRRRLDLALALVHEPAILFLDEPTTGLDPASRRDIWDEVRRLNRSQGMTIFLTTQYLEEADELADRVAIINHGRIAVEGRPETLKAEIGTESINLEFETEGLVESAQSVLAGEYERIQIDRNTLRLYMPNAASAVSSVVKQLEQIDLRASSITITQPTLDDVFLQVTGLRFEAETENPAVPQF